MLTMPLVLGQEDFWKTLGPMIAVVVAVIVLFVLLIIVAVFANYFRLWIQSFLTGAGITIFDLIGMTFRKVNKDVIVKSKIMAVQAGLDEDQGMTSKALEAHYLAGGNVPLVVRSLIAANKAKIIRLSFREATAIDLAGRNMLEAVQTSVYPKVIDCPGRGAIPGGDCPERHSAQGEGPRDRAGKPAAAHRRRHGGDDYCPRRRRDRQCHRQIEGPHGRAGESRSHFARGARPTARLEHGV